LGFGNALPGGLIWGGVLLTILALYLLLRDDSAEKSQKFKKKQI
jgi:small neutral amino acid transporter SnatA (MarC family)